jgi:hypothetical protein
MITEQQMELLKQYKEKAYVNSLLCEQSHNYYVFIKNIINIPLIITNSAMVIINAIITDQDLLKVLNIILNSSTGLILSLISNFKVYENIQQFHQLQIKFNKLSHQIDSKITNDINNISTEYVSSVVDDYDAIYESIEFQFPNPIKKRIKKQFENKLSLPTSLTVEIVSHCEEKSCCVKPAPATP